MIWYKIRNSNDKDLFWSNSIGWVDRKSADLFTVEQKNALTLPVEGKWIKINTKRGTRKSCFNCIFHNTACWKVKCHTCRVINHTNWKSAQRQEIGYNVANGGGIILTRLIENPWAK